MAHLSMQVEIYYLHAPDVTTPIEETLEAINMVYKAGKFRHVRPDPPRSRRAPIPN